jgi:protein-disulfide isomerase
MVQLMDEFEGQVRWVYRHFPLSFHPQARPAAIAAECAGEQGKFWEFVDGLFANQTRLGQSLYDELAAEVGLNESRFDTCMTSQKFDAKVSADLSDGSAAGVTGTPGTVLVGSDGSTELIPGAIPYDQLKLIVEAAL